jgi:hypothetical protein
MVSVSKKGHKVNDTGENKKLRLVEIIGNDTIKRINISQKEIGDNDCKFMRIANWRNLSALILGN